MTAITPQLAKFAAETRFEDLPESVVHEAKLVLLDCIGCALAALETGKGKMSVQLAKRLAGPPEATVIGDGGMVSAANAAFANGELINALDYDVGAVPPGHSSPCVVPAGLALGESVGASGKDLITALVIGHEISARLGSVLTDLMEMPKTGLALSSVHGYSMHALGAAASGARVMKLDAERMAWALGIAGYNAPVPAMIKFCKTTPIPMTKYASTGWISHVGVTAAMLAEMGYTGDTTVLDGDYGFWRYTASDGEKWNPRKVMEGLGKQWFFDRSRVFYKQYPACGLFLTELDELGRIMEENQLAPDDIESVRIVGIPLYGEAVWTSKDIRTNLDAQFSVAYNVAAKAYQVTPADWQAESTLADPRIKRFMMKVSVGTDPQGAGFLEVVAKGRRFVIKKGQQKDEEMSKDTSREHGMTIAQSVAKFKDNASKVLTAANAENAAQVILQLEKLNRVSELTTAIVR